MAELPEIKIVFDPAAQTVVLRLDTKDFKTWDYVLGILAMAVEEAKMKKAQTVFMMQQRAMADMRQTEQLRPLLDKLRS